MARGGKNCQVTVLSTMAPPVPMVLTVMLPPEPTLPMPPVAVFGASTSPTE